MAVLGIGTTMSLRADDKSFGDAHFIAYGGSARGLANRQWRPGYQGLRGADLPQSAAKKYKIVGRIYDPRTSGIGIVGRGLAEGLFPEKDRQRDCARQAQYRDADAVLVTRNKKFVKAFGLKAKEIEKTAPLFDHKDDLVLAIKFE